MDMYSTVEEQIRQISGWESRVLTIEPAIPVLASPSWRGVDGVPLRVVDVASGESLFVKKMNEDAAIYIDLACSFEAACRASDLGIGPKVLRSNVTASCLVMEDLTGRYTVAGLHMTIDPAIVDRILTARSLFRRGAPLSRGGSVFDEINRFFGACRESKAKLPDDATWLFEELQPVAALWRQQTRRTVPIHGDGNVSNIMISPDGTVLLLDWDRAGNADPLEDLGVALREFYSAEAEALSAFLRNGAGSARDFDWAWTIGIADDLRWGLIAALMAHQSRRTDLEFYKFASWRFLRCGMAIREPRFAERLRRLV